MSDGVVLTAFEEKPNVTFCVDLQTRDRQVSQAIQSVPKRLEPCDDHGGHIAVVCYGPSLEQTWEDLREYEFILTCSGAHKFLIDRGIIPTGHVAVDPRHYQVGLLGPPHPDVEYLLASCCHPSLFEHLRGYNVKIWHVFSHEAPRKGVPVVFPRGDWCLTGGTNAGIRAMMVARFLGFRRMTLFGMDFSFRADGTQHAGWHNDETKKGLYAVEVDGEYFYTNPAMHSYAVEFFKEVRQLGQVEVDVVGHGLLQAKIKEYTRKQPLIPDKETPTMIAAMSPQVISPEYAELNRQLHESNPAYGISGSKRVEVVKKLIETIKPASILDYGCGKGTLGQALPMPIWEYDPAIPGKDTPPRPAELVVCTDVLEHIEPEYLDAVLLDLSRCTMKVCYALVYTQASLKMLPDGRNTHLIQQPKEWWDAKLAEYFTVAKSEANGPEVSLILGPKKKEPANGKAFAPPLDISKRVTVVRHDNTDIKFHTPTEQTLWRANTLFTKEPITIEWIESFADGDTLYDIGANVGGYSVWAGVRKKAKVIALEPESGNYALLCRNLTLNRVDGAAYCLALSDARKLSTLYLSSQDVGGSCHSFDQAVGPDLKQREGLTQGCLGLTLDELATYLPAPDHLKIDVDGLEHTVIAGAAGLLQSGRIKSLLLEVNTTLPEHQAMLEVLRGYGYTFDAEQVARAMRKDGPFKGCAEHLLTRIQPVEQYVLEQIQAAPMRMEPFPHLFIEHIFPDDFYNALVAALPTEGYRTLQAARGTPGYPERFVHAAPASVAWLRFGRFRKLLDDKFGVHSGSDETLLLRDHTGYRITPHTDTPTKAVTALFYLPTQPAAQHGTSLYAPCDPSFRDPEGRHHAREQFTEVWRTPATPNSVLIFARTDTSFHGVEPYTGPPRDVLLYDTRLKG